MKRLISLLGLLILLANLCPAPLVAEDAAAGERVLTPNEERHIQQANQELPKDMVGRSSDSRPVAALRDALRKAVASYQQAVRQFGNGKPETRQACHHVVDVQKSLHQQVIKEEAIPALSQVPN